MKKLNLGDYRENNSHESWQTILNKMTEQSLRSFLFSLAENDRSLQKKIVLNFSTGKISKKEVEQLLKQAEALFGTYEQYGYIGNNDLYRLDKKIDTFLGNVVPYLLKRHCSCEVFDLLHKIYSTIQEMADDGYEIECLEEICENYWRNIIEDADPVEKRQLHQWFVEKIDAYQGKKKDNVFSCYESLLIYDFHDQEFMQWALSYLDRRIQTDEENGDLNGNYAAVRLRIMKKLNFPENEIKEYTDRYYPQRQVRQDLIHAAFARKDYQQALKVIKDSQRLDADDSWAQEKYKRNLIYVYQELGDLENVKEALWQVIQTEPQYNMDDIQRLKKDCKPEEWKHFREEILHLPTCRSIHYDFLASEKMYDELWGELKKAGDTYRISCYEHLLQKDHGEELRDYYCQYVRDTMPRISSRSQYRDCISYLKKIKKYPGGLKMARQIADEWYKEFNRRKAMKEELAKAGF